MAFAPTATHLAGTDRLAVALDFPTAAEALRCVDRLNGSCQWMKVGMQLYYAAGDALLKELLSRNLRIFLDLKLHDIPNTVAGAVRSLATSGASFLTVHASGGEAMLRAASDTTAENADAPRLLAVTVLTSMDSSDLQSVGVQHPPADQVLRLARLAAASGISGFVCSTHEAALLRQALGPSAFLVVPGIRPGNAHAADQRRTATPRDAILAGASMLVVGRPITSAVDPEAVALAVLEEIELAASATPATSLA